MSQYLLVTHGTRGDVDPFLELARALVDRGGDACVLTHTGFETAVRATGAAFRAVDDASAYDRYLGRTPDLIRPRPPGGMDQYYRDRSLFLDRLGISGGLDQIRREVVALAGFEGPAVIVGRHTSALSAMIAAEVTGSPLCLVALSPTQLHTSPVAGLHLARTIAADLNSLRAQWGLPGIRDWSRWIGRADLVAGLWPRWFDAAGAPSPPEVLLPGFALSENGPAEPTTDLRNTVLITGGTGRMLHPDFYPAAVAGVHAAGQRAVVVTPHADLLLAPLPSDVTHLPSLAFESVMPHAAAVVHHGGAGTVARALRAQTPQLILAYGGDRPDNAARLQRAGVAASLAPQHWSASRIADAVAHAVAPATRAALAGTAALVADSPAATLAGALEALATDDADLVAS